MKWNKYLDEIRLYLSECRKKNVFIQQRVLLWMGSMKTLSRMLTKPSTIKMMHLQSLLSLLIQCLTRPICKYTTCEETEMENGYELSQNWVWDFLGAECLGHELSCIPVVLYCTHIHAHTYIGIYIHIYIYLCV